jgi:hypothetical protein
MKKNILLLLSSIISCYGHSPLVLNETAEKTMIYSEQNTISLKNPNGRVDSISSSLDPELYFYLGVLSDYSYVQAKLQSVGLRGSDEELASIEREKELTSVSEKQKHLNQYIVNTKYPTPISGKTGKYKSNTSEQSSLDKDNFIEDIRGFTFYLPEKNTIVVALHGSRDQYDWLTNLDASLVDESDSGLKFNANLSNVKVHRGFGRAVESLSQSLEKSIKDVLAEIKEESGQEAVERFKKEGKILFTGHSQGAAVAALASIYYTDKHAKDLFGPDYDNSKQNQIQTYVFSMPRVFAQKDCQAVNNFYGKHNIIRQNVWGDLVPIIGTQSLVNFYQEMRSYIKKLDSIRIDRILEMGLKGIESAKRFVLIQGIKTLISNVLQIGETTMSSINNSQILSFLIDLIDPSVKDLMKGNLNNYLSYNVKNTNTALNENMKNINKNDYVLKDYEGYGDIGFLALDEHNGETLNHIVEQFLILSLSKITNALRENFLSDISNISKGMEKIKRCIQEAFDAIILPSLAPYHYGLPNGSFDYTLAVGKESGKKSIDRLLNNGMKME